MAPLAEFEDFDARHGPVGPGQEARVEALLEDASSLVLAAASGSAEGWVLGAGESGAPDPPPPVVAVCIAVAYRAWNNPGGVKSETLGAHSVAYRGDGPDALWLTKQERRIIRQAARLSSFRAVTLASPYSGDDVAEEEIEEGS